MFLINSWFKTSPLIILIARSTGPYANLTPDVFSIMRLILKRSSKWTLKFIELLNFTQSNTVKLQIKREFLSAIFVDPNRNWSVRCEEIKRPNGSNRIMSVWSIKSRRKGRKIHVQYWNKFLENSTEDNICAASFPAKLAVTLVWSFSKQQNSLPSGRKWRKSNPQCFREYRRMLRTSKLRMR